MLEAGIKGHKELTVTEDKTAKVRKSGTLNVFATPALIELIEETAWTSVADELDEGMVTVGTNLNVAHLSATPVGMKVFCNTVLTEVDGRKLVFSVEVEDEAGKISQGVHERFIVQADKFQKKADAKEAKA